MSTTLTRPFIVTKQSPVLRHLVQVRTRALIDDSARRLSHAGYEVGLRWRAGEQIPPHVAEVIALPSDQASSVVMERCRVVDRLVGATAWTSTRQCFEESDRINRTLAAEDGVMMTSFFNLSSMSAACLGALAIAADMPYFCSYVPLQMKILDTREVLVPGPPVAEGQTCLVFLRRSTDIEAAWHYVRTIRQVAVAAATLRESAVQLTRRQHEVARLLIENNRDESVAQEMGVSVRTVRHEVAEIMAILNCSNRFAAGAAYAALLAD